MNIYPSQDYLQKIFTYNNGHLIWNNNCKSRKVKGKIAGWKTKDGYWNIRIENKSLKAHRLIWIYHNGNIDGLQLDHINKIKHDNRIENLRVCFNNDKDNSQNRSTPSNNTSGYIGVTWHKQNEKWQSQIMVNGKKIYLGTFDNLEEAIESRKQGELKYFTFIN